MDQIPLLLFSRLLRIFWDNPVKLLKQAPVCHITKSHFLQNMFLLLIWICFYQLTVFLFKCENTFKTRFLQFICLLCFIPAASRQQQKFKTVAQVAVSSRYVILSNMSEAHDVLHIPHIPASTNDRNVTLASGRCERLFLCEGVFVFR